MGKDNSEVGQKKVQEKFNQALEIKNKYQLEGAKVVLPAKDKNGVRVEIGGDNNEKKGLFGIKTGAAEFVPDLKMSRWEDEVSFKIKADISDVEETDRNLKLEDGQIKFETPAVEYKFYELPADENNPEGAYELEVIWKEKPATNKVELALENEGLNFFYQPALNEDKAQSAGMDYCTATECYKNGAVMVSRPENIVGSYAVYHSGNFVNYEGGKEYKTGKAFHIYRPLIIDAEGKKVWGEFNKDLEITGKLAITVPQDFLDKAVYPVVVDPTFGYTGVMATASTFTADNIYAINPTVLATGGTLSKVTVYASGAATTVAKMGVYADNSNYPGTAVSLDNTGVNLPTSITWRDSGSLSGTITNGSKYWLAIVGITNNVTIRTETITGEQAYYKAGTSLADPYPSSASDGGTIRASFYATYTAEANTVSVSPTASGDDGSTSSLDNAFDNVNGYINLGEYNQDLDMFVRFPNVAVPKNAIILSAYIVYTARYNGANNNCITKMYFNDVDNATAPTTWSGYHNLASTTAEVDWTITPVVEGGAYTSPDIKSLVQEIVSRSGWASGNAMMLLHENNPTSDTYAIRYFTSWDDTTYTEPVLRITYTENSTPTINSVEDTPDPLGVGANLKFNVNWSDADSGEMAKVVVCKTYEMATTTLTCGGGAWATSDKFTNRNPESVTYTTVAADKGNTRNYYVYVCDDSGLTTGCATPTAGTFTVANQIPDAPISLLVEGMEIGNAINLTDATPEFSFIYKDSNDEGDLANKYCVEVDTQSDFAGTEMWTTDSTNCYSGTAIGSNVLESARAPDVSYAGTALSLDGTTYYWRSWFWDDDGERSATSTTGWFRLGNSASGDGVRLKGGRLKGGVRLQ